MINGKSRFLTLAVAIALSAMAPAALGEAGQSAAPFDAVRLIPQWIPQAQFAGYYMAREKGFYTERGLDVTILRGCMEMPPPAVMMRGEAEFGTLFLSQALEQRQQGVPLLNIAQVVQRSAQLLVARKSSGIRAAEDLQGHKVSIWTMFRAQPLALFRKLGLDVEVLPQSSTLNLFLRGGVDAAAAMWYNEYHLLLDTGIDEDQLTVIFYDAYGLNFPEDGIYCLEKTFRENPARCAAFVQASLQGWSYAFAHEKETLDVVMRLTEEAHTGTNLVQQRWMLERMRDIILPEGETTRLGELKANDYQTAVRELKNCGIIADAPALDDFHVSCLEENR